MPFFRKKKKAPSPQQAEGEHVTSSEARGLGPLLPKLSSLSANSQPSQPETAIPAQLLPQAQADPVLRVRGIPGFGVYEIPRVNDINETPSWRMNEVGDEEGELQLALAVSRSEAEIREQELALAWLDATDGDLMTCHAQSTVAAEELDEEHELELALTISQKEAEDRARQQPPEQAPAVGPPEQAPPVGPPEQAPPVGPPEQTPPVGPTEQAPGTSQRRAPPLVPKRQAPPVTQPEQIQEEKGTDRELKEALELALALTISHLDAKVTNACADADFTSSEPRKSEGPSEPPEEFSEELVCPVCLEMFRRATTLGCGHTFCAECLVQAGAQNNGKCPLCRATIKSATRCVALDNIVQSMTPSLQHWPTS